MPFALGYGVWTTILISSNMQNAVLYAWIAQFKGWIGLHSRAHMTVHAKLSSTCSMLEYEWPLLSVKV